MMGILGKIRENLANWRQWEVKKKVLLFAGIFVFLIFAFVLVSGGEKGSVFLYKKSGGGETEIGGRGVGFFGLARKGLERIGLVEKKAELSVSKQKIVKNHIQTQKINYHTKKIASEAILFLDKAKRKDGFYNFYGIYSNEKKQLVIPQINSWTILARVSYYRSFSKKPVDLFAADDDLGALVNFCKGNLGECVVVSRPLIEMAKITQDKELTAFLRELGFYLLRPFTPAREVMSLGTQARDLAFLYEFFGEDKFINQAQKRLREAEETAKSHQDRYGSYEEETCYIVLAKAEIGRVTGNKQLLAEASNFFNEGRVKDIPRQMTLIQPCAEAAVVLGRTLEDGQLLSIGKNIISDLVVGQWDGPGLGRGLESGGFFRTRGEVLVNVTDTGYMVYLLSLFPEKEYEFKI